MASCQIKKSIIDTQKIERNLSITLKKKTHQKTRKESNREELQKQGENN